MSFTVGETSYLSIADADAYFAARDISVWASAPLVAKEASLMQATTYLDGSYNFVGDLADYNQALAWPRVSAFDSEGRPLNDVPRKVEQACAELALLALAGDLAPPENRGGRVLSETVGSIAVAYAPDAPSGRTYPFVELLMTGLLRAKSTTQLVRS